MQKAKKITSILLAVIMFATIFTCFASAGAPAPTGTYKTSITYEVCHADGTVATSVTPGEIVTVNVYGNSATANDNLDAFAMSIYFDPSVYTYIEGSVEWTGLVNWVDATNSPITLYQPGATAAVYKNSSANWTDEEKAAHPGWDTFVYVIGTKLNAGTAYQVQENADSPMYNIKLKVNDDAPDGGDATVGCPASVYFIRRGQTYNHIRTVATGAITAASKQSDPTSILAHGTIPVASAPAGLTVADWKDQIRFDKNADGTYAETFDFRTLAKIGNFDGVFDSVADAQGADDGDYIVDAGFVFNRGAAIDADAAKAQVESGNGSYSIVPNAYISTSYASGEYVMACLVKDIPDASKSDTLSCMGYVKYVVDGEPMYAYGEVSTDTFNTLYSTYYSQAFGA